MYNTMNLYCVGDVKCYLIWISFQESFTNDLRWSVSLEWYIYMETASLSIYCQSLWYACRTRSGMGFSCCLARQDQIWGSSFVRQNMCSPVVLQKRIRYGVLLLSYRRISGLWFSCCLAGQDQIWGSPVVLQNKIRYGVRMLSCKTRSDMGFSFCLTEQDQILGSPFVWQYKIRSDMGLSCRTRSGLAANFLAIIFRPHHKVDIGYSGLTWVSYAWHISSSSSQLSADLHCLITLLDSSVRLLSKNLGVLRFIKFIILLLNS